MPQLKNDILWRIGILYILMVIFALAIIAQIAYLQFGEKEKWTAKANNLTLKDITIEPNRGDICSADGRVLASSIPSYEIRMDFQAPGLSREILDTNLDSLALCLSQLFGDKNKKEYLSELKRARNKKSRYHLIRRKVSYLDLKELKKFPLFRLGQYKGGFIVIQDSRRAQPFVNLASRTIGYTTKSETGNAVGIEGHSIPSSGESKELN
jgi:cell division protein FtsI (penicillin-binding protein 3)